MLDVRSARLPVPPNLGMELTSAGFSVCSGVDLLELSMGVVALVSAQDMLLSFCGDMIVLEVSSSCCSGGGEDGLLYMIVEQSVKAVISNSEQRSWI